MEKKVHKLLKEYQQVLFLITLTASMIFLNLQIKLIKKQFIDFLDLETLGVNQNGLELGLMKVKKQKPIDKQLMNTYKLFHLMSNMIQMQMMEPF